MFHALDYGVLAGYFGVCAFVGWWTGRGQKDSAEYFKGGGQMPVWAVCLSILASEMSALTFCSVPGMSYTGNFTYFQFVLGNFFGRLLVAFLFIPAFYTAGITSVYEFLGLRFGPLTRGTASLLFFVTRILASGVRVTAAAIAVKAATGWPFPACVIGFTAVTVLYTVYGGIKSIIWTDVLQFFLFFGGAAFALALILGDVGGSGLQQAIADSPTRKLQVVDPTWTFYDPPYTLLTSIFGGVVFTFATHGTDQDLVQRMLTCRGSRQGSQSVILSGLISLPTVLLFLFIGTCLYAFYLHHPDLRSALPTDPVDGAVRQDWIFPHFIVHQLPSGIRGLVMAAVFAAAMSTTASAIGALALVAMVDGIRRFSRRPPDERRDLALSRVMSATVSGLLIVVALVFERVSKSLLNEGLAVMTYAYGALLGVFCLGRLTRSRGSDRWNVIAMLLSVVTVVAVKIWTPIAWPWFTVIGFAMTFALGAFFPGPRPTEAAI